MLENSPYRLEMGITKISQSDKNFKQEWKLTFNGIHKSYTNYKIYNLKQNEVLMDKPINVGFVILKLSKLHMYET